MGSVLDGLDLVPVARARWFASKGREVVGVREVASLAPEEADGAALVVCDLTDAGGGSTRYALPLRDGREAVAGDALWPALARLAALPGVEVPTGPGRALADDLSNTTVVLGERLVVKAIRLVEVGSSPEAEALAALDGLIGVPGFRGSLELDGATVVVLQEFIPSVGAGWEPFIERLVLLAAGREDILGFVRELGALTGRIHLRLSERLDVALATPILLAARRDEAERSLDALAGAHPTVAARAAALRERLALLDHAVGAPLIRIHGDLHVGQVLLRPDGSPAIVDFDGEPGRTVAERRAPWTPLQDIASLRLSFDNAAAAARKRCLARGIDPAPLLPWADAARSAVLEGWLDALTPPPTSNVLAWYNREMGARERLLGACEALKQLAELRYAERFLPEWLYAPLETLERRFREGA